MHHILNDWSWDIFTCAVVFIEKEAPDKLCAFLLREGTVGCEVQ